MSRKVKYDYRFKLRCVKEVLNNYKSVDSVSKLSKIRKSNLTKWIDFYKSQGPKGLIPRENQCYSVKFKATVLQTIAQESLSLSQACVQFDIPSASTIIKWQQNFINQGIIGLNKKPRGRPITMKKKDNPKKDIKPMTREEELLLENKILKAENALLKKFDALIRAKGKK